MKTVCDVLDAVRSAEVVRQSSSPEWRDGRRSLRTYKTGPVAEFHHETNAIPRCAGKCEPLLDGAFSS